MLALAATLIFADGVFVNGQGPYRFLVDTGAQATTVSPKVAAEIGTKPMFRARVRSVSDVQLHLASLYTIEAQGLKADSVEIVWRDNYAGVDGVLGQSFLSRFAWRIDHRRGKWWIEHVEPSTGERYRLHWVHGRPAIETGGKLYVLDSGANRVFLFHEPPCGSPGVARVTTHSGAREVRTCLLNTFQAGPIQLRGILAAIDSRAGTGEAGLLPTSLFDSVYVNARAGYAVIN